MKYRIKHTTRYRYEAPVSMCFNEARMSPLNSMHQTCAKNRFVIHPIPDSMHKRFDYFANNVTSFDILQPHRELSVTVHSEVQVIDHSQQSLFAGSRSWEQVRDSVRTSSDPEVIPQREYLLPSPLIPIMSELQAYAQVSFTEGRDIMEAVRELTERIFKEFKYDPSFTSISTPLETVLEHRRGVCQDFAHLAIACVPVAEYAPNAVKKTVVGVGHAQKAQVDHMVRMMLPGAQVAGPDAADALAIALCHAHHARFSLPQQLQVLYHHRVFLLLDGDKRSSRPRQGL